MNRQIVLESIPEGMPQSTDFSIVEAPLQDIGDGELLVRPKYLSVDPYMRGRMSSGNSSLLSFEKGKPLEGAGNAEIVESRADHFKTGELIKASLLWQEFQVIKAKDVSRIGKYIHSPADYLGVLGLTGLTAYFGIQMVCKPIKGETVVISGAAGAVGSVAGQICKLKGCRVIGIAGSNDKINLLREELHFDEAFNYHNKDWEKLLSAAVPQGTDIYFDNVGGEISDAVLRHLNMKARILVCGQISLYNSEEMPVGPRVQPILLEKKALMQGFTVRNYSDHFEEATQDLSNWMREGKLVSRQTIFKGFESLPEAFIGLFEGKNTGKSIVEIPG
jgi:NADPH-dependent curcumin reductase CurA